MVSLRKTLCLLSLVIIVVHVILLDNILDNIDEMIKTNMVSELTWEQDTVQLQELGIPSLLIFLNIFLLKVRWSNSPP